ncbi:MAG: PspA/IM30 family protein [Oscillospiraceae bacterium]|nr:PspA/IM30 family protein [Oscillospiraceae bacterium]
MGVFSRLSDILKSNINDLLDKAEDPEKMVKQIIIDMQKELTTATQNLGKAKASERLAQKKMDDAVKVAASWESKAKAALSQGNQDLAKQALAKKVRADEEVATYTEMYESISTQTDAIEDQVEVLKAKLDEAKSRQAMLIARSQMADTKKALAKSQGGFDGASALEKFDRMEEKIMQKEAEAQAYAEIAGQENSVVDDFEKLENDSKIDSELARLKAEMGM